MLKQVFKLKIATKVYVERKGNAVAKFNNQEWIEYFAFLVNITTQELNSRLQRNG